MSNLLVKCMCGTQLSAPAESAGMIMRCPACNQQFRIPGSSPAPQAPSAPDWSALNSPSLPPASHTPSSHRPVNPRGRRTSSAPQHTPAYLGANQRTSSGVSDQTIRMAIIGAFVLIGLMIVGAIGLSTVDMLAKRQPSAASETPQPSPEVAYADDSSDTEVAEEATAEPVGEDWFTGGATRSMDGSSDSEFAMGGSTPMVENTSASLASGSSEPMGSMQPDSSSSMAPVVGASAPMEMTELIEHIEHSVVRLDVEKEDRDGIGSGFMIDNEGTIVTNFHVIEDAKTVRVSSSNGQETQSIGFVAAAPLNDICIIKVDPNLFSCTPIARAADPPRKGTQVAAFGSPLGFSFSATSGIVSAYRSGSEVQSSMDELGGTGAYDSMGYSNDMYWVQTSAAISGGNSGGPLVNMLGEVVGMNTFKMAVGENLNFAVALATIEKVMASQTSVAKPFSDLPKSKASVVSSGELAAFFGSESIVPSSGQAFEKITGSQEVRRYSGHDGGIIDLAISSDGRYLAAAGLDKKMTVFDMSTGELIYTIETTTLPIRGVEFALGSKYLVTFRSAGTMPSVSFRDPTTGKATEYGIVSIVPKEAADLAVSQDGRSVFASWIGGQMRIRRFSPLLDTYIEFQVPGGLVRTTGAAFTPDGNSLFLAEANGTIIANELSGEQVKLMSVHKGHNGTINSLVVAPHGRLLASGGDDGGLYVWKNWAKSEKWKFAKLNGDLSQVITVAFSPDSKLLAAGRSSGRLEIWSVVTNRLVTEFNSHDSAVSSVVFLPTGKHVVSGTANGQVRIFSLP